MAKATVTVKYGNVELTAEGEGHLELMEALGSLYEVFASDTKCGHCGGEDLYFRVRNVTDGKKEYKYPEKVCADWKCRAKLSYGQLSNGTGNVFPKRKLENGTYDKEHGGWQVWKPEGKEERPVKDGKSKPGPKPKKQVETEEEGEEQIPF